MSPMRLLGLGQFDHALGCAHVGDDLSGAVRNLGEAGGDLFGRVVAVDEGPLGQGDIGAFEPTGTGRQDAAAGRRLTASLP